MASATTKPGPEHLGEYLLEARAEEIPARMLEPAVRELATRVFEELMARGAAPAEIATGSTPRRLLLVLRGLPEKEPDSEQQVVGPPVKVAYGADGQPTPALQGFARKLGVALEDLQRVATDKGEYVAAQERKTGRPMSEVLAEIVPRILAGLSWAKTMVWGSGYGPWARPLHGLVSLLDGEVVPFTLFGVAAGRTSVGHPVLSPQGFEVAGVDDYFARLAERGLLPRPEERQRVLAVGMEQAAERLGGTLVADPSLAAKLAAICEIPGVLEGSFDPAFLALPREVLITSLRDHQSAFTVEQDGELLPAFLTVMDRPDDPIGRVRSGNEWVVAARLADARFFYGEDGKRTLAERAGDLASLTFHVDLGSYAEKTGRIAALARWLCAELGREDLAADAEAAARLLKVDLTTEMVKEFTSLQGVMGGLYARNQEAPEAVWQAIYDQYLPASTEDALPRGLVGQVVGLADRLDSLVGIFGLGLIPSGSRDPFGLRRAAQGVVRIALEGKLALDLEKAAAESARLYGSASEGGKLKKTGDEILASLRPFLADRVRYLLGLAGYAYDEIEAVLAAGMAGGPTGKASFGPLADWAARVAALHTVREEKDFLSLVLSAKRIANILKDAPMERVIRQSAANFTPVGEEVVRASSITAAAERYPPSSITAAAERHLWSSYTSLVGEVEQAAAAGDYERYLRRAVDLAQPLDSFFTEVMVMTDDLVERQRRIELLQGIAQVIGRTARLTEMVIDRAEHRARHGE